jgi:hypothetical protein
MGILGQIVNDIAPPVQYSVIPPWMIFAASLFALTIIGVLIYYGRKIFRKKKPTATPPERAMAALAAIENEIENLPPYRFSIRVSDILRRYVMEQFDLPMTRQTSLEFLNAISGAGNFTEDEKALLTDFLNRCDLIKFARYEATIADSRLLLDEARQFVKGGALVPA